MIRTLSIGNSFSQDATRYLHQIAAADGTELTCVNLYIGGCPLERHYKNMQENLSEYGLEINGTQTGEHISISSALQIADWDFVTMQQVSHQSPDYATYQPYLKELSEYVHKLAPNAKQIIHQTWAYEENSDRLNKELGFAHHQDMFEKLKFAYEQAAESIGAAGIIESGALFEKLLKNGIEKIHRDTFHATFGLGRYALGLLWYHYLTGSSVLGNTFTDLYEPATESEFAIVKQAVSEMQTL